MVISRKSLSAVLAVLISATLLYAHIYFQRSALLQEYLDENEMAGASPFDLGRMPHLIKEPHFQFPFISVAIETRFNDLLVRRLRVGLTKRLPPSKTRWQIPHLHGPCKSLGSRLYLVACEMTQF
jgi:hypothetical protein